MPSKNTIKQFAPDQMYHLYNRGVDKRVIFLDQRDYAVFLSYLKYALLPEIQLDDKDIENISSSQRFNLRRLNLHNRFDLVAFCLMPNHFHLLAYQHDESAITALMRSVATGYSMYFNKRYHRQGTLFQGRYKASLINSEAYWLHISRYIHLNPIELGVDYKYYDYSSYRAYSDQAEFLWLKTDWVLNSFKDTEEYEKFVKDYTDRRTSLKELDRELTD